MKDLLILVAIVAGASYLLRPKPVVPTPTVVAPAPKAPTGEAPQLELTRGISRDDDQGLGGARQPVRQTSLEMQSIGQRYPERSFWFRATLEGRTLQLWHRTFTADRVAQEKSWRVSLSARQCDELQSQVKLASLPFLKADSSGIFISHAPGVYLASSAGEVSCFARSHRTLVSQDWTRLSSTFDFVIRLGHIPCDKKEVHEIIQEQSHEPNG